MYCVYKKIGETPLECLEFLRNQKKIDQSIPMTYAGRLDPMAEGLLIVLEGEECKEKEKYTKLDKVYEFEILVGFSTDTHDMLGLVTSQTQSFVEKNTLDTIVQSFIGTQIQEYPLYSSKTYNGKQLFEYGRFNEPVELPKHTIKINSLECTSTQRISKHVLLETIVKKIHLVQGDFRQKEIIQQWQDTIDLFADEYQFQVFRCMCSCSSGTYIRQLVSDIASRVGVPLVTFSIKRTRVGEYSLLDIE